MIENVTRSPFSSVMIGQIVANQLISYNLAFLRRISERPYDCCNSDFIS